jgi:hypothetical protein
MFDTCGAVYAVRSEVEEEFLDLEVEERIQLFKRYCLPMATQIFLGGLMFVVPAMA